VKVLGSAQNRPDSVVMEQLVNSDLVLLALDNDQAGIESSYNWWLKTVPNAKRWAVLNGKDPGDSYQNGVNIRQWIQAGILNYISSPRFIPMPNATEEKSENKIKQQFKWLNRLNKEKAVFINIVLAGDDPFKDSIKEIQLSGPGSNILKLNGNKFLSHFKEELNQLFSNESTKIFYNAKLQIKSLINHGFNIKGQIFDQKLSKQLIYTGTTNVEDHVSIDLMKSDNKSIVIDLQQYDLGEVSLLESQCIPILAQMELNGMLIDKPAVEKLKRLLKLQLQPIIKNLISCFGNINFDSHIELKAILNSIGLHIDDTKKKTLIQMLDEYPFLQLIIYYRQIKVNIQKCDEILRNINSETGRVYPIYNQIVDTGRMSCSKPNIHGMPKSKKFRRLFIAPPGSAIIRADFSQIELRVAAEMSGDSMMIKAFNEDHDLHALTASLILEKPVKYISKSERQQAKAVNFGILYGIGAKNLQESAISTYGVYLSLEDAEKFKIKFYSSYKGFAYWQQQQLYKTETRTLSKRRRIWKNQIPKPTQLFNSPIQGTAADILKKSLVLLSDKLLKWESKIIGTIHDEILVETPGESTDDVKIVVEKAMIEAGECYLKSIPLKVDVSDSGCWK